MSGSEPMRLQDILSYFEIQNIPKESYKYYLEVITACEQGYFEAYSKKQASKAKGTKK